MSLFDNARNSAITITANEKYFAYFLIIAGLCLVASGLTCLYRPSSENESGNLG